MNEFKLNYKLNNEVKYLGISSVCIAEILNIQISKEDNHLETIKNQISKEIFNSLEDSPERTAVLQSYKEMIQKVNRSLKKFPPSAENLLNTIKKRGAFPHINTLVDAYNTVAAKTGLSIGVHDLDMVDETVNFRLSPGDEPFKAIGSQKEKKTQPGDYVYSDNSRVLAWLDSKDSDDVKIRSNTKNVLIVIQGTHVTTKEYKEKAISDICSLICEVCGGTYNFKCI